MRPQLVSQHATCTQRQCNRSKSAHNPGVRRHSANTRLQPVSTQPTIKDIATARRQHATHAVGCHTTNAHPLLVSTQPAHRGNAIARSQHTTPAVRRLSTNAHLQLVSTQSTIKDIATARRQHATHAVGRRTTNVDLLPVSTQPAHTGNATARRQHTTLAVGRATHSLHLYQMSGRHDVSTKPCQDASTPQLVSTQPAPRGIATDRRQHTTLAVGRPTTNAHLYQLLQHTYRGSGRHDTSTCTKPCPDASTPQPVSTQPAPSGDAS